MFGSVWINIQGKIKAEFRNINITFNVSAEVPLQDLINEDNTKKTGTYHEVKNDDKELLNQKARCVSAKFPGYN